MKKLIALLSGFIFAGVVNAQNTAELTTAQMDQVTAGSAASAADAGASVDSTGLVNIAGTSTFTSTNAIDVPGHSEASAYGSSDAAAFTIGGSNSIQSTSNAGVVISE